MSKITLTGTDKNTWKTLQDVRDTIKEVKENLDSQIKTIEVDWDCYNSLLLIEKKYLEEWNSPKNLKKEKENFLSNTKLPITDKRRKEIEKDSKFLVKKYYFNRDDFGEIEIDDVSIELMDLYRTKKGK